MGLELLTSHWWPSTSGGESALACIRCFLLASAAGLAACGLLPSLSNSFLHQSFVSVVKGSLNLLNKVVYHMCDHPIQILDLHGSAQTGLHQPDSLLLDLPNRSRSASKPVPFRTPTQNHHALCANGSRWRGPGVFIPNTCFWQSWSWCFMATRRTGNVHLLVHQLEEGDDRFRLQLTRRGIKTPDKVPTLVRPCGRGWLQ